jgi:hypothetical protein
MQTICVTECVPETYQVKRISYKQVCKQETYTAFRCECFPVTKTCNVTTYTKKAVWKDVTCTVYEKVPCWETRTVMKPCYSYVNETVMKSRKVDKGHWVCEEVPAHFKAFCQRLGQGHGHNNCCDPCACPAPCPPTRTVKKWCPCWVTECYPCTVCKKVCTMVPETCKVCTYKCVAKQVCNKVCSYECVPCVTQQTYTCYETKQVPFTCTRNVMTCVPCEEMVTCTRYVAKTVYRQVPVSCNNNCCESFSSCCSSGGHGHGHKLFSNFRGHGHNSCNSCGSSCGSGCGGGCH